MTHITVPLEELEEAARDLDNVLSLLENGTRQLDLEQMLGNAPDVMGAARTFDRRWSDGRKQLIGEGQKIRDKIREATKAFVDTDNHLAEALDQDRK
ncbi:hypothetical protein [Arthrobacter zhaoguopingii]|uniref:hypothetical protein n=1 Tax=Arthrobacter zhaoguopingii TaxID=2681491 RepID=UPI00135B95E8|nr:hypothetical protein [Arthrobacter zhaoguopingii]